MKKSIKTLYFFVIFLVLSILIYTLLPIHIKYYFQIKHGNTLIDNINNYQKESGKLPKNQDYQTLEKLQFNSKDNYTQPEYQKLSETDYKLTYIRGFDCPYLMWSSQHQEWRIDCH